MERIIGRTQTTSEAERPVASRIRRDIGNNSVAMVKDIAWLCLSHWWWFVLALGVTMGYAVLDIKRTAPVYLRTVSILIKSEDKTSEISALADMGLTQISTNITNEILSLKSGTVAAEIVRRLNLDVEYIKDGAFHEEVLYGVQLPVTVSFIDLNDAESVSFRLRLSENKKVILSNFTRNGTLDDGNILAKFNDTIPTPVGRIVLKPTGTYHMEQDCELTVR